MKSQMKGCFLYSHSSITVLRSLTDIYNFAVLLGNRCCVLCMEIKSYLVLKFESCCLLSRLHGGLVQTSDLVEKDAIKVSSILLRKFVLLWPGQNIPLFR